MEREDGDGLTPPLLAALRGHLPLLRYLLFRLRHKGGEDAYYFADKVRSRHKHPSIHPSNPLLLSYSLMSLHSKYKYIDPNLLFIYVFIYYYCSLLLPYPPPQELGGGLLHWACLTSSSSVPLRSFDRVVGGHVDTVLFLLAEEDLDIDLPARGDLSTPLMVRRERGEREREREGERGGSTLCSLCAHYMLTWSIVLCVNRHAM
jgi:hypothetical protein